MSVPHFIACWLAVGAVIVVGWMLCANGWHHQRQTTHRAQQDRGEVGGVGLGVSHLGKGQ